MYAKHTVYNTFFQKNVGRATGAILNFSISLASGSSFDDALKQSGSGFVSGFVTGSVAGAGGAYANAKTQGLNPWTGKNLAIKTGTTVFRAVDATEAAIIKKTEKFTLQKGGVEAKYFAKSL